MRRLGDGLSRLWDSLKYRRRERAYAAPAVRTQPPVVRGCMRRMLVIKPPGDLFTEAVFILRDDYFQAPGLSRQELLQQAKTAAGAIIDASLPSGKSAPLFPSAASVFALGAACAVLALWLAGLIG